MISHWYLVKRNWPQTKAKHPFPLYAGLGGEVWPFDPFNPAIDKELKDLHTRLERSRTIVDFGSHTGFVCTDRIIADEYFVAVKSHYDEAWLLQLTLPDIGSTQISGLDIGDPSGGYSIIESELITEGMTGPSLNQWGLIQTLPEALALLEMRKNNDKLEQMDEMTIVA